MIKIYLGRQAFEYDVYSLVKAFFPAEEIQTLVAGQQELDCQFAAETGKKIKISFQNGGIQVFLSEGEKTAAYQIEECAEDSKEVKNQIKLLLYQGLQEDTKQTLPWGTLTGIRPVKIPRAMLEHGKSEQETAAYMKQTYLASDKKIALSIEVAKKELEILSRIDAEKGYSLYIGIPFCPTTCLYCSFTSYPVRVWAKRLDEYVEALCKELVFIANGMKHRKLNTVYMGGGTPTTLEPKHFVKIFEVLKVNFEASALLEFTVEAGRPDSITREKLKVLKEYGITRLSINPQTMKEETLKLIGRQHTAEQTIEAFLMAREAGFDNINMDLIAGLPNETLADMENTMQQLSGLKPDSITVHSLAVKRAARLNTQKELYQDMSFGNNQDMLDITADYSRALGLFPYYLYRQKNMTGNLENIGYSMPGKEGIYNILIMEERQTIMAAGAGASSKIVFPGGERIERTENVKDVKNYLDRFEEMLTRKKRYLTPEA